MKIALFHEVVSGGARRGANEFAKALRSKGHIVDLYIVAAQSPIDEKDYYDSVYYYPFIPKEWKGKSWKHKLYKDTIELYTLYTLHKKIAADIAGKAYDFAFIHPSQYTQAPFLLRFLDIPKLYYCQEPLRMIYEKNLDQTNQLDFFRKRYERMTRKIRKVLDRQNILSADIIFANSTFTQKNIYDAYALESIVCHMGVDIERFHETTTKKDIDILYIGSDDPIDGYDLFEQTLRLVQTKPQVECLMRGKKWLTNDRELADYYSRAKVVLCFGKREPFGLIPLEAMSCGAVVIALDEGGYTDSVEDKKTGFLVAADPKIIAKIIDEVLQSTTMLVKMSEHAKQNITRHWQWDKSAECILDHYILWKKTR